MDLCRQRYYFDPAMMRHVLTLLALITGLAAISAPAQARLSAPQGAELRVEDQSLRVAVAWHEACALPVRFAGSFATVSQPFASNTVDSGAAPCARAFHLRIDRARE